MGTIIIFGLLSGLDNLQVAPALGALDMRRSRRWMMAAAFGLCETIMPLAGAGLGRLFQERLMLIGEWVGPMVLVMCGALIIYLAREERDFSKVIDSPWLVLGLPISMSIDNLLAGVGLGATGYPVWFTALAIGGISAAMCLFGLFLGGSIRKWIPENIEILSGAYLMIIAVVRLIR
ncbi:MAG: manganese efflux pump MntP family protein [Blastocatellia bacterium]|nr:manganese efflux pump MntP family protein [Blastocatellia bacterium]